MKYPNNPSYNDDDYEGCVTAGRPAGVPAPPISEEDIRTLEAAWNNPRAYELSVDEGFVGAGWVPKPADAAPRELTVGGPTWSEPSPNPDGVATFYFHAPDLRRYMLTVHDAAPLQVDVRDPDGNSLPGLDVVGGNVRATVLLAPGRYSVRVARDGAAGAPALQIASAS